MYREASSSVGYPRLTCIDGLKHRVALEQVPNKEFRSEFPIEVQHLGGHVSQRDGTDLMTFLSPSHRSDLIYCSRLDHHCRTYTKLPRGRRIYF
jgi:hypothetical protein